MNLIDRAISTVAPIWAYKRKAARLSAALLDQPYNAASTTRRATGTWLPHISGPNVEVSQGPRDQITARARDAYRNQPIARAAIGRLQTNVIGTGLRLQSKIDHAALGIDVKAGAEIERNIEREWRLWAEDPSECDVERTFNFYQLQDSMFCNGLVSGDVFGLTPFVQRTGGIYGLKLQVIESDRVSNPSFTMDTENLTNGIEHDKRGAPLAYHVLKAHPGDTSNLGNSTTWQRIRVFGPNTGRRRALHLTRPGRPGQKRSISILAPIIESLKQIDRYTEAEIMAAVVSSMFTVFVKSPTGASLGGGGLGTLAPHSADGENPVETNANSADEIKMGNGLILELKPDEDISTANPGRPNQAFEPFFLAIVKQIGAALGIPAEVLLAHFQSSFSAARGALLEARKTYYYHRGHVSSMVCQPMLELLLDEAVARGRLSLPGYAQNDLRRAYSRAQWIGPAKGHIQEVQAVNAAEKRINIGISTIARESAEMTGTDWDQNHDQRAIEVSRRKEDGLQGVAPVFGEGEEPEEEDDDKPEDEKQEGENRDE